MQARKPPDEVVMGEGEDGPVEDAETEYVDGVFWQINTPDRRVRGQLKFASADLPELIVDGLLFDESSYSHSVTPTGMTIAKSADPHDRVADFSHGLFMAS